MSDPWSDRAELYRTSSAHSSGPDLDLIVEWAEGCRTAIDVATGGGHVARRLREAGLEVVSCDPAPGMAPDVICFAEELPFADSSFELAVTRVAAHHFADVAAATRELARVASKTRRRGRQPPRRRRCRACREAARSLARAQLHRAGVARLLRRRRDRARRGSRLLLPDRARALARAHCLRGRRGRRGQTPPRRPHRGEHVTFERIALRGRPEPA